MKEVLAVVLARKGTKGFPGKHLRLLAGKPVIQYAFDYLAACALPLRTVVSTDDEDIRGFAQRHKIEVVERPPELATDEVPVGEAFHHAVMWMEQYGGWDGEFASLLHGNIPVRPPRIIEKACEILSATVADSATTVVRHHYHPHRFVTLDANGVLSRWMDLPVAQRQDLPEVFYHCGECWTVRASVLRQAKRSERDPHWMFGRRIVGLPCDSWEIADIDEPNDLAWAEFVIRMQAAKS